jgi:hypothetical protein
MRAGEIALYDPAPLDGAAWEAQLPYLRRTFPRWDFAPFPGRGESTGR